MRALIIGAKERARIKLVLERARANVLPLATLVAAARPFKEVVTAADRNVRDVVPPSQHVEIPEGYVVACSLEEQPVGLTLHLSISVDRKGKTPSEPAVRMILEEFGVADGKWDAGWLEEFAPGHHAVNVVRVLEPVANVTTH